MLSVLNPSDHPSINGKDLSLFLDLNIDQIINFITQDWDEETGNLYYQLSADLETEKYRKDIFDEIISCDLIEYFEEYLSLMKYRKECEKNREEVDEKVQKQVWQLKEISAYISGVELLKNVMDAKEVTSAGLKGIKELLDSYVNSDNYAVLRDETNKLINKLNGFNICLVYENDRIAIAEGQENYEYEEKLKELFPKSDYLLKSPFSAEIDTSYMESSLIDLFRKKNKDFFLDLSAYSKVFSNYIHEDFLLLEKEIKYYLSFYRFMKKMEDKGFSFCRPSFDQDAISADGLYDLALACLSTESNKPVIDNSIDMFKEEKFLVLTGPNQGGKTTFARSLGQLVYFSKMGLYAPARSAKLPFFASILTHFSVEESLESGKGKLMEELTRLKPMVDNIHAASFVVINELFTTAANYDAVEMGKRVLEKFVENDCKGIYVTHLGELASCSEGLVSLRAMVDENNHQTFKVARGEYEDFFGPNILVEKYKLSYEKIRERLS